MHYPYFDLFRHTLPIFKNTKTVVTVHDVIPLEFPDHYPPGLRRLVQSSAAEISSERSRKGHHRLLPLY